MSTKKPHMWPYQRKHKCEHIAIEHLGDGEYICMNKQCRKLMPRKELQKWEIERNKSFEELQESVAAALTESDK